MSPLYQRTQLILCVSTRQCSPATAFAPSSPAFASVLSKPVFARLRARECTACVTPFPAPHWRVLRSYGAIPLETVRARLNLTSVEDAECVALLRRLLLFGARGHARLVQVRRGQSASRRSDRWQGTFYRCLSLPGHRRASFCLQLDGDAGVLTAHTTANVYVLRCRHPRRTPSLLMPL